MQPLRLQDGFRLCHLKTLVKKINYEIEKKLRKDGYSEEKIDKITLSVKIINNNKKIEDQKEICLTVSSYEDAKEIIDTLGCQAKAYQESKRELWKLDNVEITLDEWPFLEPFVEIEGPSEQAVQAMAKKLGFEEITDEKEFEYKRKKFYVYFYVFSFPKFLDLVLFFSTIFSHSQKFSC